jgi:uncharacterized protein
MHHHHTPDEELLAYRAAKDEFFREDPHSPIPDAEREAFTGLNYFPPTANLRLELPLDRDVPDEPVTMPTSTGGTQEYRRAGRIHFAVDSQEATLTIFESGGELFLPLRDATSGSETYPAGRYLEPEMADDGTILVDFNYLYNPNCAYDEIWSCPVPPPENWLTVPIRAGEMKYHP